MKKILLGIGATILGLFVLLRIAVIFISAFPGLGYQLYKVFVPDGFETCEKNGGMVYVVDGPRAGAKECYLKGKFYNSEGSKYSSANENCANAGLDPIREEECIKGSFGGDHDATQDGCSVDSGLIKKEPQSTKTICRFSTLSGDPEKRLFVLDKISDVDYVFRIVDAQTYKTQLYREEIVREKPFTAYFSYYTYSDLAAYTQKTEKQSFIILDSDLSSMPGFPVKNSGGYKVVWK